MGLTPYTSPFGDHRGQLDSNYGPIPGLVLFISASFSSRHRKLVNETTTALQLFSHNSQSPLSYCGFTHMSLAWLNKSQPGRSPGATLSMPTSRSHYEDISHNDSDHSRQ
ncbi:hypothetical protein CaCOL14_010962 [Colletotrichum acutatum]